MKKLILALTLSLSAHAVELRFIGPCSEDFIMRTEVAPEFANVGQLTVATLAKFGIPFKGSEMGLASAFETPTGDASVEVISDTELRAYGWCYAVNGVAPEVYPHEVVITSETRSITWTYGFAHFKDGQWITQCTPAYEVKPAALCED